MTPEKLGLFEIQYLNILEKVLKQTLDKVCHLQIEEIVLAYGHALKDEVLNKQKEQIESEAIDDACV